MSKRGAPDIQTLEPNAIFSAYLEPDPLKPWVDVKTDMELPPDLLCLACAVIASAAIGTALQIPELPGELRAVFQGIADALEGIGARFVADRRPS